MPAPSASAGTGSVSSGGVLSTQRRQSARRRCREGTGGLATVGSAKSPRACRAPPWPRPERFRGRHLQPPERAAVSRPEARSGSRPRFPPEPNIVGLRPNVLASPCAPPSARGARRRAPLAAPSGTCAHSRAQLIGFRAGRWLAKVVAKAFRSGMTRGKRTGGEQTAARSPMPAQPAGRRCTSSPAGIRERPCLWHRPCCRPAPSPGTRPTPSICVGSRGPRRLPPDPPGQF